MIKEIALSFLLSSALGLFGISSSNLHSSHSCPNLEFESNRSIAVTNLETSIYDYVLVPMSGTTRYPVTAPNGTRGYVAMPNPAYTSNGGLTFTASNVDFDIPIITLDTLAYTGNNADTDITAYPLFQLYFDSDNWFQFYLTEVYDNVQDTSYVTPLYTYKNNGLISGYSVVQYFSFSFVFLGDTTPDSFVCSSGFDFTQGYMDYATDISWTGRFYYYGDTRRVTRTFVTYGFSYLASDDKYNYQVGWDEGFEYGKEVGNREGYELGAQSAQTLPNIFLTLADIPIMMIQRMFSFDLFGIPVYLFIFGIVTMIAGISVAFILIKLIKKV